MSHNRLQRLLLVLPPHGTRSLVVALLRQHYPISVTTSVDDIALVMREDPTHIDLVLVDMAMGSGVTQRAADAIRRADPSRRVPLIVISSGTECDPLPSHPSVDAFHFHAGDEQPWEMLLYHVNAALFPRERDERTCPRVLLRVPVLVAQTDDAALIGEVFNISLGGVFLRTNEHAPVGTQVSLRFPLPPDEVPIVVVGEVVRVVRTSADARTAESSALSCVEGVGVRFLAMDPSIRRRIARFVLERAPSGAFDVLPLSVTGRNKRL